MSYSGVYSAEVHYLYKVFVYFAVHINDYVHVHKGLAFNNM